MPTCQCSLGFYCGCEDYSSPALQNAAKRLEATRPGTPGYRAGFDAGFKHGLAAAEQLNQKENYLVQKWYSKKLDLHTHPISWDLHMAERIHERCFKVWIET